MKSHLQKHRIKVAAEMQRQGIMPASTTTSGDAQPPLQAARQAAQQQAAQQRLATAAAAAAAQLQHKASREAERAMGLTVLSIARPKKQRSTSGSEGGAARAPGKRRPTAAQQQSPAPSTPQQPLVRTVEVHAAPSPQSHPSGPYAYAQPTAYRAHAVQYHTVQHMAVHHPGDGAALHYQLQASPYHQGGYPYHRTAAAFDPALMMEPGYPTQDSPLSGGGSSAGRASAGGSQAWEVEAVPARHASLAAYGGSHHSAAAAQLAQQQAACAAAYGAPVGNQGSYGTTHFATRHASMLHMQSGPAHLAPQPTAPAALWSSATAAGSWPDLTALDCRGSAPAVLCGPAASSAAHDVSAPSAHTPSPCALISPTPCGVVMAHHTSDSDCGDHFDADIAELLNLGADDLGLPGGCGDDLAAGLKLEPSSQPLAGTDPFAGLALDGRDLSWALGSGIF